MNVKLNRFGEEAVRLEDYFEFLETGEMRIKGTRIGIETVLEDYLDGASPEEIAVRYPSLSLEQVYAAITYYLHNKEAMDSYLKAYEERSLKAWADQNRNPSPLVKRLKELKRGRGRNQIPTSAASA